MRFKRGILRSENQDEFSNLEKERQMQDLGFALQEQIRAKKEKKEEEER